MEKNSSVEEIAVSSHDITNEITPLFYKKEKLLKTPKVYKRRWLILAIQSIQGMYLKTSLLFTNQNSFIGIFLPDTLHIYHI